MLRTKTRSLIPRLDRGPLRTMFVITSMPIGGAETLLVNLMRRLDRDQILPELCCLKEPGPLGEAVSSEVPVYSNIIRSRFDFKVLGRLRKLIARQRIDAVITVGAGDKMFWGRLAAYQEDVPVILSALHSTGWPDGVGRINRFLTPITDGFIAVARGHGEHLVEVERFPREKVHVIYNGIDTYRFRSLPDSGLAVRQQLGIPADSPVCGIVAAIRPEKNHLLFLRAAALASKQAPHAHFLVVGDGPERMKVQQASLEAGLAGRIHFLGSRSDIPQLLSAMNVLALTSHNEASPVSILEAMACEVPVVATRVGSVAESVRHGETGFLVDPGDAEAMASHWLEVFRSPEQHRELGARARDAVLENSSLERMVQGYQDLVASIYDRKSPSEVTAARSTPTQPTSTATP